MSLEDVLERFPGATHVYANHPPYKPPRGSGHKETIHRQYLALINNEPHILECEWREDMNNPERNREYNRSYKISTTEYHVGIIGKERLDTPDALKNLAVSKKKREERKKIEVRIEELKPVCPACQTKMILRENSKNGSQFWGCRQYPRCKYTQKISKEHKELKERYRSIGM